MSRHCREDDDDGGGPATKVPRESIDDNPTRGHTRSSLPALDLEKCLLCDSKKKKEKLLKPRGTYPLYLGVFPNDSAQRCSNTFFLIIIINDTRILMRKDDVWSWRIRSTSRQTFMRRKWCTMPASYRKYTSPKSLDSVSIANKENAKSPSDHSTTEPNDSYQTGIAFKCLTSMIEEWITGAYCIMSLLNHIVPYVWQVTARWSTGKSCQRVQFEELDHMIKRHFDMVFHRPNKCTESQYVFSSEVPPGPIIEGCLRLDEAQERAEEKELAMKWCAWWAESQWCIRRDTTCV